MDLIWIGMAAGFIATVILSAFMLMKNAMGLMPQLNMIGMIAGLMNSSQSVAWMVHLAVGTVLYGGVFGWLAPAIGDFAWWIEGAILGAVGWLIAMLVLMPMADNGVFGLKLGPMVPVMALVMHLVFGAVLGWSFGLMLPTAA